MKIINQVDTSNWKFHCTCIQCETEMEADKNDIKYLYHASSGGSSYDYSPPYDEYYIFCPVCNEKIEVPEKELPKALRAEIKKKTPSPSGGYWDR